MQTYSKNCKDKLHGTKFVRDVCKCMRLVNQALAFQYLLLHCELERRVSNAGALG